MEKNKIKKELHLKSGKKARSNKNGAKKSKRKPCCKGDLF